MWQHRQEERALKRAEMDMVKQRRNVERTMKKLNDGIMLHVATQYNYTYPTSCICKCF